ncbi:ciliogenesis-associated TTC17-interacting protein [Frieseomelitta varia]|uniref:ciliogenesis-associated TTC17-interacting protein n=1 Tax=Frieseomelitta varia TaxID=561572 RepID=UPI001CB68357|nr:ciliogenesis-associated TTC17-interacting protein [Frieseomelitta varia]
MSIEGHFGGSKLISSATSKLHCLEEKRTEFMYDDGLHEKTIFMGIEDDRYHIKLTRTCTCNKSTETKDLYFSTNSTLISEGANILLMRYLALINYEGTLYFENISIDGDVAKSNYICIPAERMKLDGHFLDVYTIERKMCKEDGTFHTIRTYLTPKGRILRHNWLDVPYILKINPLDDPNIPSKTIRTETPLKDRWREDIEIFSKYLDVKFAKIAELTEYLADHPEIKQLIADYVQILLVVKPENVIDFTIQHFKAFAKNPMTWETSILCEDYDSDVLSQLAEKKSDTSCNICGFYIDRTTMKKISSTSFTGEYHEIKSSDDCTKSIYSKDSNDTTSDIQEKFDVSTSRNETFNVPLELKRTCDECQAIVQVCGEHKFYLKCPGCLKVFRICTKCSTIDQILQKLK